MKKQKIGFVELENIFRQIGLDTMIQAKKIPTHIKNVTCIDPFSNELRTYHAHFVSDDPDNDIDIDIYRLNHKKLNDTGILVNTHKCKDEKMKGKKKINTLYDLLYNGDIIIKLEKIQNTMQIMDKTIQQYEDKYKEKYTIKEISKMENIGNDIKHQMFGVYFNNFTIRMELGFKMFFDKNNNIIKKEIISLNDTQYIYDA
jgi:hypothetical protein